jgi:uncharacterized metal-binding protein YceD (DUF177 family)
LPRCCTSLAQPVIRAAPEIAANIRERCRVDPIRSCCMRLQRSPVEANDAAPQISDDNFSRGRAVVNGVSFDEADPQHPRRDNSSKGVTVTDIAPEFSRPVSIAGLGGKPFRQRIEAVPHERERLCRRFDLLALDRLSAIVELRRQQGELVLLEATFEAEFVQACSVTLDPVPGSISDRFSLVYGPLSEEREIEWGVDEAAFEPLVGDTIDIGEAVAQELLLSLPAFPRHVDAGIDVQFREESGGPFASLASLLGRDED